VNIWVSTWVRKLTSGSQGVQPTANSKNITGCRAPCCSGSEGLTRAELAAGPGQFDTYVGRLIKLQPAAEPVLPRSSNPRTKKAAI
jgi:hypothetical protein